MCGYWGAAFHCVSVWEYYDYLCPLCGWLYLEDVVGRSRYHLLCRLRSVEMQGGEGERGAALTG